MSLLSRLARGCSALLAAATLWGTTSTALADPPAMTESAATPNIEIASESGHHSLAIGGFLQARAHFSAQLHHDRREHRDDGPPLVGLPRTRLYAFGRASRTLRYRLMIGTPPYREQILLYDAYGEWEPHPVFRLRVGRTKVPVLRGWIESGRELASVDRPPAILALLPGRAVGALGQIDGFNRRFQLMAGVFERRGDLAIAQGVASRAVAARALWNIQGRPIEGEIDLENSPLSLAIGTSAMTSLPNPNTPLAARERLGGVDLALRWRGLDVVTELAVRDRSTQMLAPELRQPTERTLGAHGRVGYFIQPARLSLGVASSHIWSGDQLTPSHHLAGDLAFMPQKSDVKLVGTAGVHGSSATWSPFASMMLQVAF